MSSNQWRPWLDTAIEQAEISWSQGGIPIGAVLVDRHGEIVARGHNERVQSGDPTAHGEMSCIRKAGRRRDWHELTLVTTLSPCPMCAGTTVLYKIPIVIIGECRTFQGAESWLQDAGVDLIHADCDRCVRLMERMQQEKPDLWAEDIGH